MRTPTENTMLLAILIIIALLVIATFMVIKFSKKEDITPQTEIPDDCCGAHSVCERDRLLSATDDIIYFDDEELDVLANRSPNDYTEAEYDTIEDVLFSLREADVAGWLRSLQLRNIELPEMLRDEALMIVAERRTRTAEKHAERVDK